jgi:hypothetical protein
LSFTNTQEWQTVILINAKIVQSVMRFKTGQKTLNEYASMTGLEQSYLSVQQKPVLYLRHGVKLTSAEINVITPLHAQ